MALWFFNDKDNVDISSEGLQLIDIDEGHFIKDAMEENAINNANDHTVYEEIPIPMSQPERGSKSLTVNMVLRGRIHFG